MALLQAVEPAATSSDPVVARLVGMRTDLAELVWAAATGKDLDAFDADRIDRIATLGALPAGVAALPAAESVRFAQSQTAEQMARDVHPREIGRGVAEQIARARQISSYWAARPLGSARAWWSTCRDLRGAHGRRPERAGGRDGRGRDPAGRFGWCTTAWAGNRTRWRDHAHRSPVPQRRP